MTAVPRRTPVFATLPLPLLRCASVVLAIALASPANWVGWALLVAAWLLTTGAVAAAAKRIDRCDLLRAHPRVAVAVVGVSPIVATVAVFAMAAR